MASLHDGNAPPLESEYVFWWLPTHGWLSSSVFPHHAWVRALHLAALYLWAFLKSLMRELCAFATADTCDSTFAALFFGAFCAYLLIARSRDKQREREDAAALGKAPPVKISPALAGQAFWEKYDVARGWKSTIGGAEKTAHLTGGRNPRSRPLDALLPRREYVPKKRAWEGSGTANLEGEHVPLLRTGRTMVGAGLAQRTDRQSTAELSEVEHSDEEKDVKEEVKVVDWEGTRTMAVNAPEVWTSIQPYSAWLETYKTNFMKVGSLAASGMMLDPLGRSQGLLEVNRQFYRDVTSGDMIRLNSHPLPARDAVEAAVKEAKRRLRCCAPFALLLVVEVVCRRDASGKMRRCRIKMCAKETQASPYLKT